MNAAKTVAHHNIAKAYSQLMWLNYSDTGYAALNELYSKANAEYYEGVKWHKRPIQLTEINSFFIIHVQQLPLLGLNVTLNRFMKLWFLHRLLPKTLVLNLTLIKI